MLQWPGLRLRGRGLGLQRPVFIPPMSQIRTAASLRMLTDVIGSTLFHDTLRTDLGTPALLGKARPSPGANWNHSVHNRDAQTRGDPERRNLILISMSDHVTRVSTPSKTDTQDVRLRSRQITVSLSGRGVSCSKTLSQMPLQALTHNRCSRI